MNDLLLSLPDSFSDITSGLSPTDITPEQAGTRLLNSLFNSAGSSFGDAAGVLVVLLFIVLVCGLAGALREGSKSRGEILQIAAAVAVSSLTVGGLQGLISNAATAIADMDLYSKSLLPVLASISAASGHPTAAVARLSATVLFSGILINIINTVIFPLCYVYIILLTVDAALPRAALTRLAKFFKWIITWSLGAMLVVFTTYLSISGSIAGNADALAVKSAKLAISSSLPIVGGIISDTSEMLLVSGGVIKGTVGIFGLLTIAGIVLNPVMSLFARYFLYKLGAALCAPVADERIAALIDGLAGAFGIVLAATASCAFLLWISITVTIGLL